MDLVTTDKLYMRLNTAELEAIIKKDSPSSNDRDAGFCSASSESEGGDDLALEHTLQRARSLVGSTDEYGSVKEGSALLVRNKRKSLEPSKVVEPALASTNFASSLASGPPKKRIRYSSSADSAVMLTPPSLLSPPQTSHTNLSSAHACNPSQLLPRDIMPNPAHIFVRHPGLTTLHRAFPLTTQPEQQEPLALIARKPQSDNVETSVQQESPNLQFEKKTLTHKKLHDACNETSLEQNIEGICKADHSDSLSRPQQRNYKNMTRERRIEANARERTRVHTISAAYETLRHAVPAYASSQKLSKLSVLRVACSYILTLSRMAGKDYSSDRSEPTIAECIEAITSTIQTEGKVKRKKDE
ncbi:transcription factor ATOH1 [Drosophila virilis]|uniref:BHLH domain-containing protein n=1 Tax=Drosophila virilis TaxID=7244 RepID=B4MDA8_DROVI|nr:uncharacterized protein LOC6635754 [Drosophila virilis]EDW71169.1 uncharacterized protein Dvir_GJ16214 [Drosophila virilis]